MTYHLSSYQKTALSLLLDIYEKSATYKGVNCKNQSFAIKPEKIFSGYDNDFTDQSKIDIFDEDMRSLEKKKLVKLSYVKGLPVISKIKLNTEHLYIIYALLHREEIGKKRKREIRIYEEYLGTNRLLNEFCLEQIERLRKNKDALYPIEITVNILALLSYIVNNKKEIMERELSIAVLGDTKLFEQSYKSRVCNIILKYGGLELEISTLEKKERDKVILEEFKVFSNPSYVFFKGDVELSFADGRNFMVTPESPMAILSETISDIKRIQVHSNNIITVENLTSYNRVRKHNSTYIYLSGYHNNARQLFLEKINKDNPAAKWFHFGDIDPDGFYILKNLIEKTGIDFRPLYMDIERLINFKQYWKPLENNDIVKANSLIEKGFFKDIMSFMLENNCKLEQEIVSWLNPSV